jgi:STE24 endopeptidase
VAALSFLVMVIVLSAVIGLINSAGPYWWVYAACFTAAFSLFLTYIYPTLIAPLFNKFEVLEEGALKDQIITLARKIRFPITGIFKMDASRRSSHSNAYFTGFGKKKRIVLFDTLLEEHENDEILSILVHEMGHYQLRHIRKMLSLSIILMFVGAYIIGLLIDRNFVYQAFGFEKSIYIGLFVIAIMVSPVTFVFTPLFSGLSRKHEYEADQFALKHTGMRETMLRTILKLHKDNLSNPLPHPLYARFYYSHPTLLDRLRSIEASEIV